MAWLRNANRGRTEPSAEEWRETSHDSQGKKHSIVNYSGTLSRQSHKQHLKGAPLNSAARMKPSPFSRIDDLSSSDDSDDDDYDDHWGYGESYLPKMVRTKPERDTDYGRESPKGAGWKPLFVPPAGRRQQYTAPVSTSPKKDTNHETARNRPIGNSPPRSKPETDTQFPKAGWKPLYEPTTGRRPQYTAPVSTSPKNDMHYETANNRSIRPGLPRIKPETDTGYASDSPKAGGNPSIDSPAGNNTAHDNGKVKTFEIQKPKHAQQPQVSTRAMTEPRKEYPQETIDSSEARKRYGGKAINLPKREEEEHTGTISSEEAVIKYNGILWR